MDILYHKKFVRLRTAVGIACILCLFAGGCATTGGVKAGEDAVVMGEWEVVGDENGKYLALYKDKAKYRKDSFSPLKVFGIVVSKVSEILFSVVHAFGTTNVEVVSENLMLAYGLAFKRVGMEAREAEYSQFYGKWKGEDFVMEIREGEVCFDDESAWEILAVFEVGGDYIFLTEGDFSEYTFILKGSGDFVLVFGDYSGEVRRG